MKNLLLGDVDLTIIKLWQERTETTSFAKKWIEFNDDPVTQERMKELAAQIEHPRPLTTIYGLVQSSWPYFTVTLRNTWLRITIVLLRVVYDEIQPSTSIRKWLLIIIVGDHCTLSHAYVVYDPQRCITEIVCDRKRPNTSVHDTEKYDRNTGRCIPEKYGADTFPFLNVYNRILSCANFITLDLGILLT